jgi:hypothetical protein
MILNDKLNCQVTTIFMNPRTIHVDNSVDPKYNT